MSVDNKTYLLSFLMMDIYARVVLQGGPSSITELERAMDFCEQAEKLMQKRGWGEPKPVGPISVADWEARFPGKPYPDGPSAAEKPYPGLRKFVLENSPSPTEHPLPISDASGAA